MKKVIYLMAGMALAAASTGCVDTEKPVYTEPTKFIVNNPPLQDELLETSGDMETTATFSLVCSQPDYGFAAQADYGAQVSLSDNFTDEVKDEDGNVTTPATYVTLKNKEVHNASMTFSTFDLACAMCTLLGIDSEDAWDAYIADGGKTTGFKLYFRATAQLAGVASSFIASNNVVSYNDVTLNYAVRQKGFIWILGQLNGWREPAASEAPYYNDWKLFEPEVGCNIYAGTFTQPAGAAGFRFTTALNGWQDGSVMVGYQANDGDKDIDAEMSDGTNVGSRYTGDAVYGKGNWRTNLTEPTPMTFCVSLVVKDKPQVWFYIGKYNVTVQTGANDLPEPVFTAAK